MIRPLVIFGDARLRNRPRAIAARGPRMEPHFIDLIDTVIANSGVGLAATQIGVDLPLAVVQDIQSGAFFECVNLRVIELYGRWAPVEGCLSIPGAQQPRKRAKWIRVAFETPDGATIDMEAEDEQAQIFQHEADHLEGRLFIDHDRRDWAAA